MQFSEISQRFPVIKVLETNPIAYFCAEFALSDNLPIYSGGLGVLAADVIRQANTSALPLVGIGLLYKEGYFTQVITDNGVQDELPAYNDLAELPVSPVFDAAGKELRIVLHVDSRTITLRIWKYTEGNTRVYLLDTDVPENIELDRRLTLSLYPTDNEWRIQQEIILGIGGVRLLNSLGITPSIYHLNEGHSAFAVLEIAYEYMRQSKADFQTALKYAQSRTIFTNHTLTPSGHDVFDSSQVAKLLNEHAQHMGLSVEDIVRMGTVPGQIGTFSMTHLALNASHLASAVSKTHAQFAKAAWPEHKLLPITNGVYAPYWQKDAWNKIAKSLRDGLEISDEELWETHQTSKHRLTETITALTAKRFDPHTLTITWARRITAYKQPLLLFSDIDRLKRIIKNAKQPVQFILSGKAHPNDDNAKRMIAQLLGLIKKYELEENIVFLPNYNLEVALMLACGSDVWLNTPIKGQEACGTSGMKAALNGILQCAIQDGWTDEIDLKSLGFIISPNDSAKSLYETLESTIIPLYYKKSKGLAPGEWCALLRKTLLATFPRFTAERMLEEYCEQLYMPVLEVQK